MKRVLPNVKTITVLILTLVMMTLPVCAAEGVEPRFNNVAIAGVGISFDRNNVVYCSLDVSPYSHCSGVSGLMRLYDSAGNCIKIWSVSDYERPIGVENTYQGTYGATYTVTFTGYAYSNNGTPADRLELSVTGTCIDAK